MAGVDGLAAIDPEAVEAARVDAPSESLLALVVETFDALGDATRVRILYALRGRCVCVRDLAILVGVSESAVSHQLRLLRDRRLVRPHRSGNLVYYCVDDEHVAALLREAEYHADHVRQGISDHPYPLPEPCPLPEQRAIPAVESGGGQPHSVNGEGGMGEGGMRP